MKGNFDTTKGVGQQFQLLKEDVYSVLPNAFGDFIKDNRLLAKRTKLKLEQDLEYKTMFRNEDLKNAIDPLNDYTQIVLYNEAGEEINNLFNLPEINKDHSCLVFKVEPDEKIDSVSVVIYKGPTKDQIFLNDGSTTMEEGYVPLKSTDVVTKGYADDLLEDFTSLSYPLRSFNLYQDDKELPLGYAHSNNVKAPVIYLRNLNGKKSPKCKIRVEPFAIPNNFSSAIDLAISVNGAGLFKENVLDILEGRSEYWKCVDSENIYTGEVSTLFWKNTYELTFDPADLEILLKEQNPFFTISVFTAEKGSVSFSDEKTFGADFYIESAEEDIQVIYKEEDLQKERVKYISGNSYFLSDPDLEYELPFNLQVKNTFLNLFRPENYCEVLIKLKDDSLYSFEEFGSSFHTPLKKEDILEFNKTLKYNVNIKSFLVTVYNLSKEVMYTYEIPLDVEFDDSEETYRVKTCSAEFPFPTTGYGDPWDPTAKLRDWDPVLSKGVYRCSKSESALCFKIPNKGCYSHAKIDIEHNGKMYIKVEGKTGWLSCEDNLKLFEIPRMDKDGCFVNDNHYSFGKVVYDTPVFIRILGASLVKFGSVVLD